MTESEKTGAPPVTQTELLFDMSRHKRLAQQLMGERRRWDEYITELDDILDDCKRARCAMEPQLGLIAKRYPAHRK